MRMIRSLALTAVLAFPLAGTPTARGDADRTRKTAK
jgi:hypothetical protein